MDRTGVDDQRDTVHVRCPGDNVVAVPYDSTTSVAQLITAAVTSGDLPRADFQGDPLPWHLADVDGAMIEPQATLLAVGVGPSSDVSVTGPGVDDVLSKRNEWLNEVRAQADGTAVAGSVHANTLLALVRRTGSALDEVEELSALVGATHDTPPAIPTAKAGPSALPRIAASLATVVVIGLVWTWAFTDWLGGSDDGPAADAGFNVPFSEQASIDAEGEEDVYEFGAVAGQRIRIRMVAGGGGRLDPELILYDADDAQLARNDDNGFDGTLNSLIDIEIPDDGTYSVVARGLGGGGFGAYELLIEDAEDFADFAENGAGFFGDVIVEQEIGADAVPVEDFGFVEATIAE